MADRAMFTIEKMDDGQVQVVLTTIPDSLDDEDGHLTPVGISFSTRDALEFAFRVFRVAVSRRPKGA